MELRNASRWAIVYGATNNVGESTAKLLAKHGYSLILVDSNMAKLQTLQTELLRIFPSFSSPNALGTQQRLEFVNINFALWRDSTSLEHKVREIFTTDLGATTFKRISVFANCSGFNHGPWQACEDKLLHEVHFDQVYAYLGPSLLGLTILLNFLTRLVVYHKHPVAVLNLVQKELRPRDRISLAMRILRVAYFPLYHHQLMERLNVLHCGLNGYVRQTVGAIAEGYPLVRVREIEFDSRDARAIGVIDVECMEKEVNRVAADIYV
jgi:NAD(P)-dependent dehydrogenase (short-subunit alcohol dehydrogenase family)